MMITPIYTAILAFMLAGLFINVVRVRRKYKVGLGNGGQAAVAKASRAHGNFVETVPLIILMMAMLESMGIASMVLHGMGAMLVFSRVLHIWGLAESTGTSTGRFAAGIITVLLFIVGGLLLLAGTFGQ
jgi:uncharacterized membrane protein YecN with MAPEG domain